MPVATAIEPRSIMARMDVHDLYPDAWEVLSSPDHISAELTTDTRRAIEEEISRASERLRPLFEVQQEAMRLQTLVKAAYADSQSEDHMLPEQRIQVDRLMRDRDDALAEARRLKEKKAEDLATLRFWQEKLQTLR